MLIAPNLASFDWLTHGFGQRDSIYPSPISTVKQIHSARVLEVSQAGSEADGLVAWQPGVVVAVRTADCVPVLIADVQTHAVAALHAGWRGTAGNIAAAGVQELITKYKSRPEDLYAAIGPSIGPCCYQVGHDVARQFEDWCAGETSLDLPAINALQLKEAGVQNVWIARQCTYCQADRYFSFRREREQAGRMLSFIGWRTQNTSGGEL